VRKRENRGWILCTQTHPLCTQTHPLCTQNTHTGECRCRAPFFLFLTHTHTHTHTHQESGMEWGDLNTVTETCTLACGNTIGNTVSGTLCVCVCVCVPYTLHPKLTPTPLYTRLLRWSDGDAYTGEWRDNQVYACQCVCVYR
jgi:hypothetical protein